MAKVLHEPETPGLVLRLYDEDTQLTADALRLLFKDKLAAWTTAIEEGFAAPMNPRGFTQRNFSIPQLITLIGLIEGEEPIDLMVAVPHG